MTLKTYIPICDALVHLLDPLVEVVIHDAKKNKIAYINGKLSQRKVGDESLLEPQDLQDLEAVTYPKINYDGRLIKSISVLIEEKWLLCINCDISLFSKMQELSQIFLNSALAKQPKSLFVNDWQERLNVSVHSYLQRHNLSFQLLSQSDKKSLTLHLFEMGAFQEKNAADYVAKALKLSRATIFNYLKEFKTKKGT